jgi:acetylornithine deacetylase/succinyl-diaminopimelate desuccinylase-like protein
VNDDRAANKQRRDGRTGSGRKRVSSAEASVLECDPGKKSADVCRRPTELLRRLIRYETVNPPGNETECIIYIAGLLREAGLSPMMLGRTPERQNLVVKLPGRGLAPPFLMFGHADVVTVENQKWTHPPFAGVEADGFLWGRGALDMKGGLAMMITALLRLKQEGFAPEGDIILAVVCDEENGGAFGAEYLTSEHKDLFRGVRYAISELGGFSMYLVGKRFYPIMVSEKQRCSLRVKIAGPGGHGSLARRGGAMATLSRILHRLDSRRLPVHVTPPVKMMVDALAANMPFPAKLVPRFLSNPTFADWVLRLLGQKQAFFETLFRNTVSPTIVRGGEMINVVPSEIRLELDGRLLPGIEPEVLMREVKALVDGEADIEVSYFSPGPKEIDMGMFDTLSAVLREQDPEGLPVPFVGSGVSDARFFCKLGIQTYGFTPMILPKQIDFSELIHGADERIPVEALEFGVESICRLLKRGP